MAWKQTQTRGPRSWLTLQQDESVLLRAVGTEQSSKFPDQQNLVFKSVDEEKVVMPSHTVLIQAIQNVQDWEGKWFKITYQGKPGKSHLYDVMIWDGTLDDLAQTKNFSIMYNSTKEILQKNNIGGSNEQQNQ